MISLLRLVKVHPLFWLVLGTGIVTGYFKEVAMLFSIVFIHEMGHAVMARKFGWRLTKVELLPFGGVAETEEYGNRPVKEELLVVLAGPIQHLWLMGLSFFLLPMSWWSAADHQVFLFHNLTILLFNLLPVKPLDGGKLVFVLQSALMPYRQAMTVSFYFSLAVLAALSVTALALLPFHLNLIVVLAFLAIHHYLEWRQRHFIFMRFLIERRDKKTGVPEKLRPVFVSGNEQVADVIRQFRRDCRHVIIKKDSGDAAEEQTVVDAFFHKDKRMCPVGSLFL
ncbi:hypothetical protein CR205_01765 [Alteribacter lacisalsi]|uniref:Peptidase M50 domain-containing protein n=1 Tax=Alteribacter lacisalsi TaxID=2045244 RepID=A0A2W0H9B3_9BACI|nr:M50 family metallopeptidase [Alteribacter lacisalsi]PYZ97356.1 hypothetical protein CR205_01765 [Alteribacter lacisalsi]